MTGKMTRRAVIAGGSAIATAGLLPLDALAAAATPPEPKADELWFTEPARRWVDALPVGNGRLGAMVFGAIKTERLALNEDTLWSGQPRDGNNPGAPTVLPKVREQIFAGQYARADKTLHQMQGPYSQSFEPMADLRLAFDHEDSANGYRRSLDLDAATALVSYRIGDTDYRREIFASFPDNVVLVRLTASRPGALTLSVGLDTPLRGTTRAAGQRLVLTGKAPTATEPPYINSPDPVRYSDTIGRGMHFATVADVTANGGTVVAAGDRLRVEGASEVLILIAGATGFRDHLRAPDRPVAEIVAAAVRTLDAARGKPVDAMRAAHLEDHRRLYRRVTLALGDGPSPLPTDRWLDAHRKKADPALAALLFDFGRYLLIASSRPGSQPANLQGIWNGEVRPPWSSNYTTNINAQMNYWPAESCNLAELHEPFLHFIEQLAERGSHTARVNYGLPGWCVHHNTDLWRMTWPVGDGSGAPTWANFALAGPWLMQHVWEHYRFDPDRDFLATRAYPLLKSCAEFCEGWLVRHPKTGLMTTAPSESTENAFFMPTGDGTAETSAGCTMDIAMIRELFTNTIAAARILKVDDAFAARLATLLTRMPPYKIGSFGQLQEWEEDFKEMEPQQRHLSPLYAAFPGDEITRRRMPEFATGVARSLQRREEFGSGNTGWSASWGLAIWARLGNHDRAALSIGRLLNHASYPNLLGGGGGGPFQIDGNFGATAGIAELLLHSHEGEVSLIPTLPTGWTKGSYTGLRARGGAIVGAAWQAGALTRATITPRVTGPATIRVPEGQRIAAIRRNGREIAFTPKDGVVTAILSAGARHDIAFA
ncbi:MAG TPA: glycoside hydrolase family 95 protein [Sphingomonas sp.]